MEFARQLERIQLWVIAGLLVLGLIIFMVMANWSDQLLVALVACSVLLYYFVVAPRRAQKRIRIRGASRQTIQLAFDRVGVSLDEEGAGPVMRTWDEFRGSTETTRGVLLYFRKAKMWIPQRAFANDAERREFVKFVKQFEPDDTPP
jgi:hypothetical protein